MNPADPFMFCGEELAALEAKKLRREMRTLSSAQEAVVLIDGREIVCFASNNYLGLARHPKLVLAAKEALDRYGVGAGASRLITGNMRIHEELEASLAAFKGKEDCVLFSSGYLANLGTLQALLGRGDAVFSDALNHASIVDAARLCKAEVHVYPHMDMQALSEQLLSLRAKRKHGRILVVTDSLFSMDGDLAPLPELVEICEESGAMLMVDEAHAGGVVGPGGRGAVLKFGLEGRIPLIMGTLSKAFGAAGGFVCATREVCSFLRNKARTFIFDTALPPSVVAAALAAIALLRESPELPERLLKKANEFAAGLQALAMDVRQPSSAIVPVPVGTAEAASGLSEALFAQGVLIPAIRPPTVPQGTSRLRATLMLTHTASHIQTALAAFAKINGIAKAT